MLTSLKDTALSVALALQGKPQGFIFRTQDRDGAVRAYKILDAYPLSVGKVQVPGFTETKEILGEYYKDGLGDGFPAVTDSEYRAFPNGASHNYYPAKC
jgi:hypothetical protein